MKPVVDPRTFDARAWLLWVAAAAALAMLARNPLYSIILFMVSRLVDLGCGLNREPGSGGSAISFPLWRAGVLIILFAAFFNALFVHVGETVLLQLPAAWPLIGGPITLEALLYGAANGLILLTLLSLFLTFNHVLPASELVRLTPRAFHDLGVVVLIAITYVPETSRHLQRIREAQAIRGHRLRGLRDWGPITIPLLVGGMERAMALAESMVARGYGAPAGKPQSSGVLAALALGLMLLFSGWIMLLWQWPAGWLLLGLGVLLLAVLLQQSGRRVPHTRYRPRAWQGRDTLLAALAGLPILLILLLGSGTAILSYTPYPRLSLPPFNLLFGAALAALALPAFLCAAAPLEAHAS